MLSLVKLVAFAIFASAASPLHAVPDYSFEELYSMSVEFLEAFLAPNNAMQARMINSTFFSPGVIGRVDATRTFIGRELNTEYVFGLFSELALEPNAFNLLGSPRKYDITHFAANQNIASLSNIVEFYIPAVDVTSPLEIILWITFDKHKQISQYDVTFRYLQWQFDDLFNIGMRKYGINNETIFQQLVTAKLTSSICATAMRFCNGTNTQYTSMSECINFLTNDVPFGNAYQLGFNTLLCRMVHQPMVALQPSVHCPHIGPTGGMYCVDDRTYTGTVLQPLFTVQPFVPYGFANANATIAEE